MSIWQANPLILETLEASGNLLAHEKLLHSYPHCWRHKTPIISARPGSGSSAWTQGARDRGSGIREPCVSRQWRRSTRRSSSPRGPRAAGGDDQKPPDWCVSRQRNWGVRCPFSPQGNGELHPRTAELLETVARRVEAAGIEAWFALDPAELLGDDAAHYDKTGHTLDVWFDSGVTHAAC